LLLWMRLLQTHSRISLGALFQICPTASSPPRPSTSGFRSSLATAACNPPEFKRSGSVETARYSTTFRRVMLVSEKAEMKLRLKSGTSIFLVFFGLIALILLATTRETVRVSRREREATLRTELRTLRDAIDNYTLDKQRRPESLQDLVDAGYLRTIPIDQITGRPDWELDFDSPTLGDPVVSPDLVGFHDVHSSSGQVDLSGSAYNTW